MELYIVGGGRGARGFTAEGRDALLKSGVVLTTSHFPLLEHEIEEKTRRMSLSEIREYVKKGVSGTLSILVSGDTGFFSLAKSFEGENCVFIPSVSSLSALAASLKTDWQDIKCVSLHGRRGKIAPHVSYNRRVFFLTGGDVTAKTVIDELCRIGASHLTVTVGQNLGFEDEEIVTGRAEELKHRDFSSLSVVLVTNENFVCPMKRLRDGDFDREKVPMTKENVRIAALNLLDIEKTDTVWDIGSGTGAMTVCLARRAFEGEVWALEKKQSAYDLTLRNAMKLGSYNINAFLGSAPECLSDFPPPDKVFIGGSGGNLGEIMHVILGKNPRAAVCVTAVTMETIAECVSCFKELDFDFETVCLTAAETEELGNYHLMRGQNPVFIIKGEKNEA